jgi:hypothetical protein
LLEKQLQLFRVGIIVISHLPIVARVAGVKIKEGNILGEV